VASRIVLEQLLAEIEEKWKQFLLEPELLKGVIEAIHTDISALGINKVKKEMGSTLVGALFNREKFIVFNAGDSRLYMFRDGYLAQKTRDHSLAEQVGGNVPRNYIISCIGGGFKDIMIDIYDLTGKVKVNDLVILCSDGLTDIDMDKNYNDLENIIKNNITDLQKMNRELLSFSLEHGSSDNVSVVSVFFKE
jgi:serine/threonine protein phosphatase PrpC